ncbi:CopM family metallochaperone [Parasphingorhabdus sp.]|uniref:CopM family metallochaperone n=1 Tax=Parasphingorhabdus sp. TaxID=2709688 RepID=UPI003BB13B6D
MKRAMIVFMTAAAVTLIGCKPVDESGSTVETAAMPHHTKASDESSEAVREYIRANAKMHDNMAKVHSDPDIAFMQGMIAHHEGALEMAEIVLKHGKDPETKALAQQIIDSQRKEIEQMREWLKSRDALPERESLLPKSLENTGKVADIPQVTPADPEN